MNTLDPVLAGDWIVACRASDVQDRPIPVTMLGQRLVLFRTEGGIHCFADLCVHRGAALSLGCVREGRLVCPYHEWEYETDGACAKIPQLSEGQAIPLKAKVSAYACQERYGLVWVNLSGSDAPLLAYPEYEDSAYRNVIWGPQEVLANPPRIAENFLDVGHLAFIHQGYLGVPEHAVVGDYRMIEDADGIRSEEIAVYQPDPDGSGQAKYVYYTYEIVRPLTVRFTKRDRETGYLMTILLTIRPVAEGMSVAYGILSFNYDTGTTDEEIIAFQDMIFAQDKPIVENQKPENLPLDLQAELSLRCDRVSIAYRQYLRKMGVTLGTA
ncbi:aromatic ring-hydroxylating dioxygenase subunit alpha [Cohnella nanjingensis]|uniref:Aromatic ring-hydroxylating dioxygenase subunit alpha n=1 Tax=Cohnella nanjingensis TaxID=1387779 RepID=A0A7X0RLW5_9BACL|nr:aromatic ring-hydroxylating dioxygenase subunit alpha [Cohnella nanjingensis]MBB6669903.1 aromatic ring-hydroxylating dioxygenase subunit alpha [Cohnella nanjingensis]